MKIISNHLQSLVVIQLQIFRDSRGLFMERFHEKKFKDLGFKTQFVQDNYSRSLPLVLRGLHLQRNPYQTKLVGVTRGRIWDVAVDLRKNSPTLGQHFGLELSEENGLLLFIPAGFAHGFCVLGEGEADVFYKVNEFYDQKKEICLSWRDPDLKIPWPLQNPILSEKDKAGLCLKEYLNLADE